METLGSATVICSDKTGTLTQNRMEVKEVYVDGQTVTSKTRRRLQSAALDYLMLDCALCNDARYTEQNGSVSAIGDPTEIALIDLAQSVWVTMGAIPDRPADAPAWPSCPLTPSAS